MTELAKDVVSKVCSVNNVVTSSKPPTINRRRHAKILRMLYVAKVESRGLYKTVTMQEFAPQSKYYPGSAAVQSVLPTMSTQGDFFKSPEQDKVVEGATSKPLVVVPPGTELHRRWLWFATLTDRREISDRVYNAHCKIFEHHPEFYQKEVLDLGEQSFTKMLKDKRYKTGSPSQSAPYWLICARTLFEEFDGDPVRLLSNAGFSVKSVYAWKKAQKKLRGYDPIPGWGRKLISLYFLYLAELGYRLPEDAFPADVHAQAIMLQTGAVDFGDMNVVYSSTLAEMVRKATTDECKKRGYDVVEAAHASFLQGSNLCTKCSTRLEVKVLCPIYNECKGRVDTGPYFAKGRWPKDGVFMTKGGERPKFGFPTQVSPLSRSRKLTREPIPIIPLFG